MIDLPAFMEHSGAVLLVIAFLVAAIGVTLVMSTASPATDDQGPARGEAGR